MSLHFVLKIDMLMSNINNDLNTEENLPLWILALYSDLRERNFNSNEVKPAMPKTYFAKWTATFIVNGI